MSVAYSPGSPVDEIIQQQGFVLLDGGLATELEKRGYDLNHKLWSARVLVDNPEAIRDVHRSYLDAGADCIITATYQASIQGFVEEGLTENQAKSLILSAVDIAAEARDQYLADNQDPLPQGKSPLIAASIGPFGAYLADGSEFRGRYSVTTQALRSFHESRWELLMDSRADLFAIETIPSFPEAVVLLELLKSTPDVYAWISFSCADGERINDGTPLVECAELFSQCRQVVGIGANCTAPGFIASLIGRAKEGAPAKPVVVYPNSGEVYDEVQKSWSCCTEVFDFTTAAVEWFNLGARLLGGCCRTNPDQISNMREALSRLPHSTSRSN